MNKYSKQVLKTLSKFVGGKNIEDLRKLYETVLLDLCLDELERKELIVVKRGHNMANLYERYYITIKGLDYLKETRTQNQRFWIPWIFSTCISIISLVVAILSFLSR